MAEFEVNVAVFSADTLAPSIGLPLESVTFPVIVPDGIIVS